MDTPIIKGAYLKSNALAKLFYKAFVPNIMCKLYPNIVNKDIEMKAIAMKLYFTKNEILFITLKGNIKPKAMSK